LVAAIALAKRGRRVRVLERYKTVGAQPERWPAIDVTPMRTEALSHYLEIPIGEPQVKPCKRLKAYFWGRPLDVPLARSNLCCVERGPRKTALDGYLQSIAESLGVAFEFESPVLGQGRIASLPRDTIIATGLYAESFDALGIPYQMGWCYGAKGHCDRDAEAAIYFNDYTTDYAYWSCLNGVDSVLFFKRGPLAAADLRRFEGELESSEGIRVTEWMAGYGPTPTARFGNPRLFASDKILAGTISGMIEPFVLFGVHGALVSGKIAAMAVEDRNAAWREFKLCLTTWRRMLLNRKIYDRLPSGVRRGALVVFSDVLGFLGDDLGSRLLAGGFRAVPGYRRLAALEAGRTDRD
jgi:flavin-dependent dehydrogenase